MNAKWMGALVLRFGGNGRDPGAAVAQVGPRRHSHFTLEAKSA
jgi:hypothetical protein